MSYTVKGYETAVNSNVFFWERNKMSDQHSRCFRWNVSSWLVVGYFEKKVYVLQLWGWNLLFFMHRARLSSILLFVVSLLSQFNYKKNLLAHIFLRYENALVRIFQYVQKRMLGLIYQSTYFFLTKKNKWRSFSWIQGKL